MRCFRLCLALIALFSAGCGTERDDPPPAPASRSTAEANAEGRRKPAESAAPPPSVESPSPNGEENPAAEPPRRDVIIESVEAGNPLVVRGLARTFENSVALRVRDAERNLIAEAFTTSRGEMGNFNPWDAEIWITRDPGPRLRVEAFEFSARDGSIQSLVSETVAWKVEPIRAALMFPRGDCTDIAPFERELPKSIAMARLLVEALLAGPTPAEKVKGASSPFPRGSDVTGVSIRGGVVTVDFNQRLQNVGGACAAQAIRASVTRTLMALPTVERVVIRAGGSEKLALQP